MDALAIAWQYEPEGFELPSGRYLPDFLLPEIGCWLEVKGDDPSGEELQVCYELARGGDRPVFILMGQPESPRISVAGHEIHTPFLSEQEYQEADGLGFGVEGTIGMGFLKEHNSAWVGWMECAMCRHIWIGPGYLSQRIPCPKCGFEIYTVNSLALGRAYAAARSARFEFGESGGAKA